MKKYTTIASFVFILSTTSLWAAPTLVECKTDPAFNENTCEVCYTDTLEITTDANGWKSTPQTLPIPWEHAGGDTSEVIVKEDQSFPSIVGTTDVTITPTESDKIWEYGSDINWTPLGTDGASQTFIDANESKTLFNLQTGADLTISGKKTTDFILIKAPIAYENIDMLTNTGDGAKNRTICVLNTIDATGTTTTTNTQTTADTTTNTTTTNTTTDNETTETASETATTEDETPELNAAGPEEITAEQTATRAGPEMWIFLALALVCATGWHAWRKYQNHA